MYTREIVFVERLVLPFHGNLFPSALIIGDVDNDHDNEIVAGNSKGTLMVFKGRPETYIGDNGVEYDLKPWITCEELGTITCIAYGDVRNHGRNSLLVICAEAICHVFDFPSSQTTSSPATTSAPSASLAHIPSPLLSPSTSPPPGAGPPSFSHSTIQPTCSLHIPFNIHSCLVADVDNDGRVELVLGSRNRLLYVHIYIYI